MNFFQIILSFLKKPKFWGSIIWFLDVAFTIILLINGMDQDSPWLVVAKIIPLKPLAITGITLLADLFLCLSTGVLWIIVTCIIIIVDYNEIDHHHLAVFMPTSPSNFLGHFFFNIDPGRPLYGVFLAMILSFLLQFIVLLLCCFEGILNEERSWRTYTPLQVNESGINLATNQRIARPVFGTHVNPLDDPPPRYSSLNVSEPSDNSSSDVLNSSLPTYEEAVEVEAQLNTQAMKLQSPTTGSS